MVVGVHLNRDERGEGKFSYILILSPLSGGLQVMGLKQKFGLQKIYLK